MRNHTRLTAFILMGLTNDPQFQVLVFIFLLELHLLSVTGNLTIISLILVNSQLKSAMYFFLQNFSFLEILFTTICIPRFLYSMSTGGKTITYNACASQLLFVNLFGATEFFLLAFMAYDHSVAVCKPLHYVTTMSSRVCRRFVLSCWPGGLFIISLPN